MTRTQDQIALLATRDLPPPSDAPAAPQWIHLLPGPLGMIRTGDGRGPYRVADQARLIADSFAETDRLPIDENHATDLAAPRGEPAPARGWIVAMEARPDGIWGRVEWTGSGQALLADRAYRGISPVITHDKAGVIRSILRASLVNRPNLRGLTALNQEDPEAMTFMDKVKEMLGLPDAIVFRRGELVPREIGAYAEAVGQGLAFDPASLGAVHWHRAERVITDGAGNVSSWPDLTGRGNAADQATAASRPALSRVGPIPTVLFTSAASAEKQLLLPACFAGASAGFMICLVKVNAISTASRYDSGLPYAQTIDQTPLIGSTGNVADQCFGTVRQIFGFVAGQGFNQTDRFFLWSIQNSTAASSHTAFINGTRLGSIFNTSFAVSSTPRIGRSATSNFFNGHIAELLGFRRVVQGFERQMLEGYLAWRYGLQDVILPATHPYRDRAPLNAV